MFGDKPAPEQPKESGFFKKLVSGLEKTKQNLVSKVEQITSGRRVDESLFEELEEVLIEADCGVATAMFLVDQLRERAREEKITEEIGRASCREGVERGESGGSGEKRSE